MTRRRRITPGDDRTRPLAWCGVAALLALGALLVHLAGGAAPTSIDWQPALAWREPWRAWSAVWVHYSARHLAANELGCGLVAALGWAACVPRRAAFAWLAAWPATQLGLLAQPGLAHYGGLSGVLHAGVAIVAWQLLREGPGRQRRLGLAILAGLAAKLVLETPWRGPLAHPPGWDIATAPGAHVSGVVAGLVAAALLMPPPRFDIRQSSMTDQRKSRLDTLAVVSLVACCVLWGLNQVAAKLALAGVPPLTQAALRSLGAAALVLGWSAWRGIALRQRDGSLRGGVLAGTLFAAEFACIFVGLQFTSASRMAVFIYLAPFVVALGMPFIAHAERLGALRLAGLATAFAGVAYALAEGFTRPSVGPLQWLGDLLGVAAALLWGGTTLTIRASALSSAPAEKTLLYQLGLSGLLLAVAAPLAGESWPRDWTPSLVGLLLFQTVIVTFASYLLWFWLVRHYPATRLAAFTLLTPVFGLLAGAGLLGEPVTLRLVVALVAVVLGIAVVNAPPRRRPRAARAAPDSP